MKGNIASWEGSNCGIVLENIPLQGRMAALWLQP